MNSGRNPQPFPVELPWEAYAENRVAIEELRERCPRNENVLRLTWGQEATPPFAKGALGPLLDDSGVDRTTSSGKVLHEDLYAIGFWYMLPAAQRAADADIDATRSYLKDLERLSQEIWPALHHVLSMLPNSISYYLGEMDDWVESSHDLDIAMIKDFVRFLPEISRALASDVRVLRRGRPSNFVLDHSADLAQAAFKRAGLVVDPRNESPTMSARLVGDGAALFVAYFQLLDGYMSELRLAQALLRNRRREQRSRT